MTFSKLCFHSQKTIYSYLGIHKSCVVISVDALKKYLKCKLYCGLFHRNWGWEGGGGGNFKHALLK